MSSNKPYRRSHYFIDPKLQGRYMASFGIPMLIMLAFMLATIYFTTVTAVNSAGRILRRNVESTVALELQDQPAPTTGEYRKVLADIGGYVGGFSQSAAMRRDLMPTLLLIFGVGLLAVIIQLMFLTIYFSHKIAGPVYRFSRAFAWLGQGKLDGEVKLRKYDEMQRLAEQYNEALRSLRERAGAYFEKK